MKKGWLIYNKELVNITFWKYKGPLMIFEEYVFVDQMIV